MPVYNTPQSGPYADSRKNLRAISPGDSIVLFDGTETPESGLKSVAFVRGPSVGMSQAYTTFHAEGMSAATEIDVEASNTNVDADFTPIGTMTSELASPPGSPYFTDSGSPLFYRLNMRVYDSGDMPTCRAQR